MSILLASPDILCYSLFMDNTQMNKIIDTRNARMMRDLQSDLALLVDAGEITEIQANEWANDKAEQWNAETN